MASKDALPPNANNDALAALILDQVTRALLKAGRKAADNAAKGSDHAGALAMAYYDALDIIKEQALVFGYRFDSDLDQMDPDELLHRMAPKTVANKQ